MKQSPFPPSIAAIFILSLAYWSYLGTTTGMIIFFDAIGYESLGRMIQTQGWVSYFTNGPNREGLYPLLIAVSMAFEHITGLAFVKIMAIFGVIILFLTQALTYKILRLLDIRNGICILVLSYLALSPALNNTAFSLFSEIAAYPFVLGILLASYYAWGAIIHNKKYYAFSYGMLLGILLALATLVKGVFECIAPVYLIILFSTIFLTDKQTIAKKMMAFILCAVAAASLFYVPITAYKWLNLHYNGNFTVTNRAPWMIYGNTARRMEPLGLKKIVEALAYAPGEGVCNSLFGQKECDFWSFQESDRLGIKKLNELNNQHLSPKKINTTLVGLSAQKALQNPFQYALLAAIEGLKMFFWESTKIGFINYPPWLSKIYGNRIFNNGLRLFTGLISLVAVLSLWFQARTPQKSPLGFLMGVLIFLYILFFSFVSVLTRYALPMAPLYLISIGIWLNSLSSGGRGWGLPSERRLLRARWGNPRTGPDDRAIMPPMQKITDIFAHQKLTFSFELFPPKTEEGYLKLLNTIPLLSDLKPDFISCTYGAGGGSREKTLGLVEHIQNHHHIPSVAHLTCVLHTKNEIKDILTEMKQRGVSNVLALRGDTPKDQPNWIPGKDNFKYSWELVVFIREHFRDHFSIGVAGFPEGHVLCPDRDLDAQYLKNKITKGADYVITQLFFKPQDYFDYVARLKKLGVSSRIIPGILPITDYPALIRFCSMCGASVPQEVHDIFRPIAENHEKTLAAGIDFCLKQSRTLLQGGAPGLHFYTLNKIHPVDVIIKEIL